MRRVVQEVLTPPLLAVGLNVLAPGDDTRADYVLLVDLQRLDGNFDSKAVLEARWTLKNRHDDVIARGIYADAEPVAGKTYDVLTAAESRMHVGIKFFAFLAQGLESVLFHRIKQQLVGHGGRRSGASSLYSDRVGSGLRVRPGRF